MQGQRKDSNQKVENDGKRMGSADAQTLDEDEPCNQASQRRPDRVYGIQIPEILSDSFPSVHHKPAQDRQARSHQGRWQHDE